MQPTGFSGCVLQISSFYLFAPSTLLHGITDSNSLLVYPRIAVEVMLVATAMANSNVCQYDS